MGAKATHTHFAAWGNPEVSQNMANKYDTGPPAPLVYGAEAANPT